MLLIICGHIIMAHGYDVVGDSSWYIKQVVSPFCTVAVNVFVLISGYFGIKLNYKKLWSLNWMVTFYCLLFLLLALYFDIHTLSIKKDWMQLVPVITKQYWFITVYFALCLVSPFLNKLIEVLDKDMYKKLLLTCFALFLILPTFAVILNFKTITLDSGYGLINFMFLYMLGRYLKLHHQDRWPRHRYLLSYLASSITMTIFQVCYSKLLGFDFEALASYDTIFTFIGAVSLFMYFSHLQFASKVINQLAAGCLAVYVIHINPTIFHWLFVDFMHVKDFLGICYIILLVFVPFVIYFSCILIDIMRQQLFNLIKISK